MAAGGDSAARSLPSHEGGVHRTDRPVSELVPASRHGDGGASGKPWGFVAGASELGPIDRAPSGMASYRKSRLRRSC
jgi:hypothetical protein